MFWYTRHLSHKKNKVAVSLLSFTVTLALSCTSTSDQQQKSIDYEINIPSFFQSEIALLNSAKPQVTKTVKKDTISETKELVISDWTKELANFTTIDLNKPAYRGTYHKDSVGNTVTYTFRDSSSDLSTVKIVYENGIPAILSIRRSTKNLLYNTEENLEYVKGKSYRIDKIQAVKILGSQHYHIQGVMQ